MSSDEITPQQARAKLRKILSALILGLAIIAGAYISDAKTSTNEVVPQITPNSVVATQDVQKAQYSDALAALEALAVKGRSPKTGYSRDQFSSSWEKTGTCDVRNQVLARDMQNVEFEPRTCVVAAGILQDPYTAKEIVFSRGKTTSSLVQIDHVVALSDAWQKGAQQLTPALREKLANDGLNLLAVDGGANQAKSDGDAATWLPANKSFRCRYIARQIAVKLKYSLWVTSTEKGAMQNVLKTCPAQKIPS